MKRMGDPSEATYVLLEWALKERTKLQKSLTTVTKERDALLWYREQVQRVAFLNPQEDFRKDVHPNIPEVHVPQSYESVGFGQGGCLLSDSTVITPSFITRNVSRQSNKPTDCDVLLHPDGSDSFPSVICNSKENILCGHGQCVLPLIGNMDPMTQRVKNFNKIKCHSDETLVDESQQQHALTQRTSVENLCKNNWNGNAKLEHLSSGLEEGNCITVGSGSCKSLVGKYNPEVHVMTEWDPDETRFDGSVNQHSITVASSNRLLSGALTLSDDVPRNQHDFDCSVGMQGATSTPEEKNRLPKRKLSKRIPAETSFDRLPVKAQPNYKYKGSPVRKKQLRMQLKGYECNDCVKFYNACGFNREMRDKFVACSSRHRYENTPTGTPEGYWHLDTLQ